MLAAAEALHYQPNLLARSLATKRTDLVGILVDDFSNPYKLPTLEKLTDALQSEGMLGVLLNISRDYDHLAAITNAKQRRLDAIILFGTSFRSESFRIDDVPIYVLARDSTIEGVPAVTCDTGKAMQEICDYLEAKDYKRPMFMAGPRTVSTALGRRRRFAEYWNARGAAVVELFADRYDRATAAGAVREYLAQTPADQRCDVLMCENDILALGALEVIRGEFGLRVPDDLALVGYDDIDFASMDGVDLTTYRQPYGEMVATLVGMLAGRQPGQTRLLPGELVIRKTA